MKYSRWWQSCMAAAMKNTNFSICQHIHPTRICCCFQRLLFQESWVELYFDTSKCSLNRVRRAHITIWVCLEKILSSKLKKSKNTFWKFFEKSLHFFESLLFFMENFEKSSLFLRFIWLVLRLWKLEVTQVLAWKFAGWSFPTSVNRGGF